MRRRRSDAVVALIVVLEQRDLDVVAARNLGVRTVLRRLRIGALLLLLEELLQKLIANRLDVDDLLQRLEFGGQLRRRLLDLVGDHLERPHRAHHDERAVLHDVSDDLALLVDDHRTGRALRHVELHRAIACGGDAADRAADAHGRHRRADAHVAGMRDFAGNERQRALHQIEQLRVAGVARRIDEFADDDARIGGQVERRAVVEGDGHRAARRLQHVSAQHGIAGLYRYRNAIAQDC